MKEPIIPPENRFAPKGLLWSKKQTEKLGGITET
jgi:hypothetical protein